MKQTSAEIPKARRFAGWLRLPYSPAGSLEILRSTLSAQEELWLSLRYPSEVKRAAFDLFEATLPSDVDRGSEAMEHRWRCFRSYVRQGEGFYRGASVLGWKSSPLNYYYAFLNLAKAYLTASGQITDGHIHHGASSAEPTLMGCLDDWRVSVKSRGVFPLLYSAITRGTKLSSGASFSIADLLGYCEPVTSQYVQSGRGGGRRCFKCKFATARQGDQHWDVVAVPKVARLPEDPWRGQTFLDVFEEVDITEVAAREVFNFYAQDRRQFQFFQSREVGVSDESGDFRAENRCAWVFPELS